jgi:antitoxin HigA-1
MRKDRRKRPPTHPGELLREDILPALGVSVSGAARDLRISRQLLHGILIGRRPVTPGMALRLGRYCGNGPDLWLAMQTAHDLWHAERAIGKTLKMIPTRRVA